MGNPHYKITEGSIFLDDKDLLKMSVDERSKNGLFLGFQNPYEIPGVVSADFYKSMINARNNEHAAVVEIVVLKGAKCRYSTIQNWSNNIINLVTKRAVCYENATMEWIDGNIGSQTNMKYPACILKGEGAKGLCISIAVAGKGQYQDAGARMIHAKAFSRLSKENVDIVVDEILNKNLSVRETERLVKSIANNKEINNNLLVTKNKITLVFANQKNLDDALSRINKLIKRRKIKL